MIYVVLILFAFWLLRPRYTPKPVEPCVKHQWVEYIVNNERDGLICSKCFRRPG